MKILFLLPPSEGKNTEWTPGEEQLSYVFDKPSEIAKNVTEKDLKCTWNRFEEGLQLNRELCSSLPFVEGGTVQITKAMNRYTWVMFNAIDYSGMNDSGREYFENHFMILSGMYGIVKPSDMIGNYKLPIESKGLVKYWKENITETLNNSWVEYIVNLLPLSYMKMIDFKILVPQLVNINFQTEKNGKIVKISHWVKKIKGQWIKNICEQLWSLPFSKVGAEGERIFSILGWEKIETEKSIEINILHK